MSSTHEYLRLCKRFIRYSHYSTDVYLMVPCIIKPLCNHSKGNLSSLATINLTIASEVALAVSSGVFPL